LGEYELLQKAIDDLRNEMREEFHELNRKISELYDRLEERTVQNGRQDERISHQKERIKELNNAIMELSERQQECIKDNLEEHRRILLLIEKQDKVYMRWLIGLTLTLIPVIVGLINLMR